MDTADTDSDLMILVLETLVKVGNESRSEKTKWGIKQREYLEFQNFMIESAMDTG